MDTCISDSCALLAVGRCIAGTLAAVWECFMWGHRAYYHTARKDHRGHCRPVQMLSYQDLLWWYRGPFKKASVIRVNIKSSCITSISTEAAVCETKMKSCDFLNYLITLVRLVAVTKKQVEWIYTHSPWKVTALLHSEVSTRGSRIWPSSLLFHSFGIPQQHRYLAWLYKNNLPQQNRVTMNKIR